MRVNVYAEEMTDRIEIIGKEIDGHTFTGLRFYLELPATVDGKQYQAPFMHRPGDDDSSAVTFWGKRDLRFVLVDALAKLDAHYGTPLPAPPASPSLAEAVRAIDDWIDATRFVCPQCGPNQEMDQDGCCHACGADVVSDETMRTIAGKLALAQRGDVEAMRERCAKLVYAFGVHASCLPDNSRIHNQLVPAIRALSPSAREGSR